MIAWGAGEAVKAETPAGHYNFKNNKWKVLSAETFDRSIIIKCNRTYSFTSLVV